MNSDKKKVSTSISLDYDSYRHIKERGINLSEWVNNKILKEFEDKKEIIKRLEQEIKDKENQIKEINKNIQNQKSKEKEILSKLTEEQKEELKESIRIIKEKGDGFFEGRYHRYNYIFKLNISEQEFKELLKNM